MFGRVAISRIIISSKKLLDKRQNIYYNDYSYESNNTIKNIYTEEDKQTMSKAPYARKDNFWSKKRVENKMTIAEIAELIGENDKTVSGYFTGFLMPHDISVKNICELFGVEFETGKLEFQHAHKRYKAEHSPSLKYTARQKKPGEINNIEDVFLNLYGVVSCSEFIDIYNTAVGRAREDIDLMGILYGKVDYKTFSKIITMVKGGK